MVCGRSSHLCPNTRAGTSKRTNNGSLAIAIGLPEETYGRLAERSGKARKVGIAVGGGVIDADYAGKLKSCRKITAQGTC